MGRNIFAVLLLPSLFLAGCEQREAIEPALDVADVLQSPAEAGFARANEPRAFVFPRDHGPHPAFRNEWWYLTGNLATPDGRPFGFQATFFRIAIQPGPVTGASRWRARDLYMVHAAVTDVREERFYASQRLSRAALGLAGAGADPFRLWLDRWSVVGQEDGAMPWHLTMDEAAFSLELEFEPLSAPVLQGRHGLSQKSAEAGNASYYYSVPRLATEGTITLASESFAVSGLSWLDREWSTSALGEQQVGWDWFGLQLDDGSDLMYYRLRRADGSTDPHSEGTLVTGTDKRRLGPEAVVLEPMRHWESPRGGRYPVAWRLTIPDAGLRLRVRPRLDDQEQHGIVRYWEGAVTVDGTRNGAPLQGQGYVELTGYSR